MTDRPRRVLVERRRLGWPPGYFDELVGHRIPFSSAAGTRPYSGVLVTVTETASNIECWFAEVRPEAEEVDDA